MIEQKFNILIVEDERLVAKDISARLKQKGYDIVGIADNYETALTLFNTHLPDLVLLDINIKGDKNGIDIALQINQTRPTPFIFITAQTDAETLQKAKDTFPSAYLVKPFTTTHLAVSIDLALHNFSYQKKTTSKTELENQEEGNLYTKQDYVFIKDSNCYIKINQNDVYMIESDGNYVKIHTLEKRYLIRCTISKAILRMNKPYFVRVHRSFCVNINKITRFNEQEITIENLKVPIGRNYKEGFIKNFDLQ
jgi:DNA-binding LytR/AlgR family response regulator